MKKRINLTTQYVVLVCLLLLVANLVLGAVLMNQSGKATKKMIREHMISVADTAAATLDAETLAGITEQDVTGKSEAYRRIADMLLKIQAVQKNEDIKYIYTVRKDGDHYIFTVDPDPDKPAPYGKSVVSSDAQDAAWTGRSEADSKKYKDEWGEFYTAWSPVMYNGEVIGMVGVDFAAEQYDAQMARNTWSIVSISMLSLVIGILIVVLLTGQLRRRFRLLNAELSTLSKDVEELAEEIQTSPVESEPVEEEPAANTDSIGAISDKIRVMQIKLKAYLQFMHEQAYTDTMTGAANKTAYLDRIKELNAEIDAGTASFAMIVFDVNGLKSTNDNYGHECGDRIIKDTVKVIRRVFTEEQVYRVGGDEFIALCGSVTEKELEEKFGQLDRMIQDFNQNEKKYAMTLSFSWGAAIYQPGQDTNVKAVFRRADQAMYGNKNEYHARCEEKTDNT